MPIKWASLVLLTFVTTWTIFSIKLARSSSKGYENSSVVLCTELLKMLGCEPRKESRRYKKTIFIKIYIYIYIIRGLFLLDNNVYGSRYTQQVAYAFGWLSEDHLELFASLPGDSKPFTGGSHALDGVPF